MLDAGEGFHLNEENLSDFDDPKMHNIWKELEQLMANPNYLVEKNWKGHTLIFSVAPRVPIYNIGGLNRAMLGLFKEPYTWKKEFWEAFGGAVYFGCLGFCSQGRYYDVIKAIDPKRKEPVDIDSLWYRIDFYPDTLHLRNGVDKGISFVNQEKLRPARRIAPLILNTAKEQLENVGRNVRLTSGHMVDASSTFFAEQGRKTRNLGERMVIQASNVRFPL